MELITINVSINRKRDSDEEEITLVFDESVKLPDIILSKESINDLKYFFDKVFEYIVRHKKMIEFNLVDKEADLFREVAEDILAQMNAEIKQSESDFEEFLSLVDTYEGGE